MVITKERQDTTNKQELFMEEKTKEKEEFLKNIEKHMPFFLNPFIQLEKEYFIQYINSEWAFVIDCDKNFLNALNKIYNDTKDYIGMIMTKNVKVLCVILEFSDNLNNSNTINLSYKEANLFHNSFKFQSSPYKSIEISGLNNIQIKTIREQKVFRYEMRLNDLVKFSSEQNQALFKLFKNIFKENEHKSLILKDVVSDMENFIESINAPIPIGMLFEAFNKRMLLETKFNKNDFSKNTNKLSIYESYVHHFLKRKLDQEVFKKIENEIRNVLMFSPQLAKISFNGKFFTLKFLEEFLKLRIFGYGTIEREQLNIFNDYISMKKNMNEPFNLNIKSFKRLQAEHDVLIQLINKRRYERKEIKLKKNNPYLRFKCPDNLSFLSTAEQIANEGEIQRNCVASYIDQVNAGNCGIFSLIKNKKRYTIRLRYINKQFVLDEIKGYANAQPEQKIVHYVQSIIDDNNDLFF
jgi:hypothetical protein